MHGLTYLSLHGVGAVGTKYKGLNVIFFLAFFKKCKDVQFVNHLFVFIPCSKVRSEFGEGAAFFFF